MITQNEKDKILSLGMEKFLNDFRYKVKRLSDSKKRGQ